MRAFTTKTLLLVILASLPVLGCGETQDVVNARTEKTQLKIAEFKENHTKRMLAPNWFKRSLMYAAHYFGPEDGTPYGISTIRFAIAFLGIVAFSIYYGVVFNGFDNYQTSLFVMIAACEGATIVLYFVLWIFTFIFIGDYFIPTGLIACGIYGAVIIVPPIVYFGQNLIDSSDLNRTTAQAVVSAGRPSRKRLATIAFRALVVGVITSLAGQAAGWIGGILGLVFASVVAAMMGADTPTDHHHS